MEKSKEISELTISINLIKKNSPETFKLTDLVSRLRVLKVRAYGQIPYSLRSIGLIVPVSTSVRDGYMWASSGPVHFTKVEETIDHASKAIKAWSKQAIERKKKNKSIKKEAEAIEKEQTAKKELIPLDKAIHTAVKLLLANGYKISKPSIIYEEVLL